MKSVRPRFTVLSSTKIRSQSQLDILLQARLLFSLLNLKIIEGTMTVFQSAFIDSYYREVPDTTIILLGNVLEWLLLHHSVFIRG